MICIRIRNSFTFEWLCIRTRFEAETCSNSEMGYWKVKNYLKETCCLFYASLFKEKVLQKRV